MATFCSGPLKEELFEGYPDDNNRVLIFLFPRHDAGPGGKGSAKTVTRQVESREAPAR